MAEETTILQHPIFIRFILPFALIFFIVFAVLEKTKIFGEDKKQLNALIAFTIGLIFVGFLYPTLIVTNMILFLSVAIVIVFVALLLWGFLIGSEPKVEGTALKWFFGIALLIAVSIAVFWAMGIENQVFGLLFQQTWSKSFWTNAIFLVVIGAALAWVFKAGK